MTLIWLKEVETTAQKPAKLRHMLSQHGELGRVYLVPEDPLARKRRKQAGRNSGKNFTEGWVEFEDKRVAKQVPAGMRAHPVSLSLPDHAVDDASVICLLPSLGRTICI